MLHYNVFIERVCVCGYVHNFLEASNAVRLEGMPLHKIISSIYSLCAIRMDVLVHAIIMLTNTGKQLDIHKMQQASMLVAS